MVYLGDVVVLLCINELGLQHEVPLFCKVSDGRPHKVLIPKPLVIALDREKDEHVKVPVVVIIPMTYQHRVNELGHNSHFHQCSEMLCTSSSESYSFTLLKHLILYPLFFLLIYSLLLPIQVPLWVSETFERESTILKISQCQLLHSFINTKS